MSRHVRPRPDRGTWVDDFFTYGYLLFVAVITLMAFRYTTMLSYDVLDWRYETIRRVRMALAVFVGVKLARDRGWRPGEMLLGAFLCGALAMSWQNVERQYVIETVLLIVGAHGVDARKIVRVWCVAAAAALIGAMVLSLAGVIENLTYQRGGRLRYAFGIIYPTDFAAHVFFLAAGVGWLRRQRISYVELGIFAALAVFCAVACGARNNAVCILVLAAWLAVVKVGCRRNARWRPSRALQWVMCLSAPLLAVAIIALSRVYSSSVGWMAALNRLLSGRLVYGRKAFNTLALSRFGIDVEMVGRGGTTELTDGIFFLDSSYVNALFCFGVVVLAAVLTAFVVCALRHKRLGDWARLGVLAAAALQCLLEHHMLELSYNVFLLLPLAAFPPGEEQI